MQQILIDFGVVNLFGAQIPIRIYGYGLMMVLGFLSGIALARWRAKKSGEDANIIPALGVLALVGGVAGARIAYVIENWREFSREPNFLGSVLNVTSGGLIYYGGVAGAAIALVVYLRLKRRPLRRYGDILAVSFMVGLAFGRAGCLLNGCCYGGVCDERNQLAARFPMYSRPLLKLDSSPGPFSAAVQSPSPVFSHQWQKGLLGPRNVDERLVNMATGQPLSPAGLHGALARGQLDVVLGAEANAEAEFALLRGGQSRVNASRWAHGLSRGDAFLRGSEPWEEAAMFAESPRGLDFAEAWDYQRQRKALLLRRFDEDGSGSLDASEQAKADAWLRADLFAMAAGAKSLPVKPAQAIAMANALVLAAILWAFYGLRWREGQVFALLLTLYPLTRIVEEAIRDDNAHNFARMVFTHNQVVSMFIMLAGAFLWLALRRLPAWAGASCRPGRHE
jgi:prolipoprotein diacylglyceryltransferase